MMRWPSVKAKQLLAALQNIGWEVKRVTGSHRALIAAGIPGLRLLLSRPRGDWSEDASAGCEADQPEAGSLERSWR